MQLTFKNLLNILTLSFLFFSQEGRSIENSQEIVFTQIKKVLVIKTENGVCSFNGKYPYKLQVDQSDRKFRLVCEVLKPDFNFNSEIPIELIENFQFPERIQEDIKFWHSESNSKFKESKSPDPVLTTSIIKRVYKWGTEYFWETPSSGSTKYSYLQPNGTSYCIRVKVGGLERLSFNIKHKRTAK